MLKQVVESMKHEDDVLLDRFADTWNIHQKFFVCLCELSKYKFTELSHTGRYFWGYIMLFPR